MSDGVSASSKSPTDIWYELTRVMKIFLWIKYFWGFSLWASSRNFLSVFLQKKKIRKKKHAASIRFFDKYTRSRNKHPVRMYVQTDIHFWSHRQFFSTTFFGSAYILINGFFVKKMYYIHRFSEEKNPLWLMIYAVYPLEFRKIQQRMQRIFASYPPSIFDILA